MSAEIVKNSCKNIVEIITKFGRMSLDDAKECYQKENGAVFPLGNESDKMIRSFLTSLGLKSTEENGKYFYEENSDESSKRKLTSPSDNNVVRKRSKSASGMNDEDKENKISSNFKTRGRWARKVEFDLETSSPIQVRSKSEHRPQQLHYPRFETCVLVGDDLIMGYVKFNLHQDLHRVHGNLRNGLCISGLTIAMAAEELKGIKEPSFDRILIYLGSIDILMKRELVQMMSDFDKLLEVCEKKKIRAVACTLAPVLSKGEYRKEILEGFNKYLKTQANISVIDVHSAFVGSSNNAQAHFYSPLGKNISNQKHRVKIWTTRGRSAFQQIVVCNLGFALLDDEPTVHSRKIL